MPLDDEPPAEGTEAEQNDRHQAHENKH